MKLEIKRYVYQDYISKLHTLMNQLVFNDRAKTKLAMLAFLYYHEFVKNSIVAFLLI